MKDKKTTTKKLSTIKKNISSQVLAKINVLQQAGEMRLPKDYSAENALKSAYLVLVETKNKEGEYALDYCTPESIANALLKMVVLGLSVMKKQCNLIMYANKLSCDLEYSGTIILAKRYGDLKEVNAVTIYKDDEFEFEIDIKTGRKKVIKHNQTLESLGGGKTEIKGAYAVMEFNDGTFDTEIMSMVQIQNSWKQGGAKGDSKAHNIFTDQMCEKTVINRGCKLLIRGSDDNVLFYPESDFNKDHALANKEHDIETNANKEEITIDVEAIDVIEVDGKEIPVKDGETADEYSERIKVLKGNVEEKAKNFNEQAQENVKENAEDIVQAQKRVEDEDTQTSKNLAMQPKENEEKLKKTPTLDVKPVREPVVNKDGQTQIPGGPLF